MKNLLLVSIALISLSSSAQDSTFSQTSIEGITQHVQLINDINPKIHELIEQLNPGRTIDTDKACEVAKKLNAGLLSYKEDSTEPKINGYLRMAKDLSRKDLIKCESKDFKNPNEGATMVDHLTTEQMILSLIMANTRLDSMVALDQITAKKKEITLQGLYVNIDIYLNN